VRRIFRAPPNSPIKDKDVRKYGPALYALEARMGRRFTPQDVVDEARDPRSPLHEFFDWDDETAADKYRLARARMLINHVRVIVRDSRGRLYPEKAFFNAKLEDDERDEVNSYVSVERVSEDSALRAQIVTRALREAEDWAERYRRYRELRRIRIAVQKTTSEIQKRKRS
jgi:hypothetical protein